MNIIAEKDRFYLPHSSNCMLCGAFNSISLKCRFFTTVAADRVYLYNTLDRQYAGYTDVIHGGIQSAVLDETMGWCGFVQSSAKTFFFTREISVKYKKNVISSQPFFVEAKMVDQRRGLVYTEGVIRDECGNVLTTAKGVFVQIPEEKMLETANDMLYINDGRKYFEKAVRVTNPRASDI